MRRLHSLLAFVALLLTASPRMARAAAGPPKSEGLKELQEHFDRENNAVHKAKLLNKVGDAQFALVHEGEKAENYQVVAETLEKYRDNVRAALEGLRKQHPDAERQSNGYRQLEMHVGRGIREVDEALMSAPRELLPPLRLVREELVAMDAEMLRLLFPSRSAPKDAHP